MRKHDLVMTLSFILAFTGKHSFSLISYSSRRSMWTQICLKSILSYPTISSSLMRVFLYHFLDWWIALFKVPALSWISTCFEKLGDQHELTDGWGIEVCHQFLLIWMGTWHGCRSLIEANGSLPISCWTPLSLL